MGGTQITLPGVTLSASTLSVGTMQVTGLTAGFVTSDASGNLSVTATSAEVPSTRLINTTAPLAGGGDLSADRTLSLSPITNTNVDAAAAIAGTKISPNFGSQTVQTSGSGSFGVLALGSGTTLKDAANVLGTVVDSASYWSLITDASMTNGFQIQAAAASTQGIFLNATGTSGYVQIAAPTTRFQDVNGTTALTLSLNATGATSQTVASTVTGFTLLQATHATVAHPMTIQAGNTTTGTGSSLTLTTGTGSVASGALQLQSGGTTKLKIDDTGIGAFGHATAGQQSLSAAATDPTSTQILANSLRTALINLGWGA